MWTFPGQIIRRLFSNSQFKACLLFTSLTIFLTSCDVLYLLPDDLLDIPELIDEVLGPLRFVFTLTGLALMLAGWKLYRFVIALPGLVLGGVIGLTFGGDDFTAILGLILGAVIGAFLALLLHDLIIFLMGAIGGAILVGSLWGTVANSFPSDILLIVAGLIGGVGLLILSRMAIIFLSSAIGAMFFGLGTGLVGVWVLLFFAIGAAVQYGLASALGEKPAGLETFKASTDKLKGFETVDVPLSDRESREKEIVISADRPSAHIPRASMIDQQGRLYEVRDGSLIGRGSNCEIHVRDRAASRQHARFRYAQDAWFIQDQGSRGGTIVNGQPTQATRLKAGDQLTIGHTTFTFREQ